MRRTMFSKHIPYATARLAAAFMIAALAAGPALASDTTTALTGSLAKSVYGQPVDFSVTVTGGAPVGAVRLMDGAKAVGTGTLATALGSAVPIATGYYHSCAVTGASGVACWGENGSGQLGDGTTTERHTPVQVSGLTSGVVAIAAGDYYTCALTDAGAVLCWGRNAEGHLGDGTTIQRHTPVPVSGLTSGIVAIAGGGDHTCALTDDGAVACWGWNVFGQLGDGTTTERHTPTAVTGFGPHTALLPASATVTIAALDAGTHDLTAVFDGDGVNAASTSPVLLHTVEKAKSRIAGIKVKPRTPKACKTARLKIALKSASGYGGTPDGKVILKDGRKKLGTFNVKNGKAGVRLPGLTLGDHGIKAVFKGANWKNSKAASSIAVAPAPNHRLVASNPGAKCR
jgi:Regulator of chromosome condensation (RCC1) repeat